MVLLVVLWEMVFGLLRFEWGFWIMYWFWIMGEVSVGVGLIGRKIFLWWECVYWWFGGDRFKGWSVIVIKDDDVIWWLGWLEIGWSIDEGIVELRMMGDGLDWGCWMGW